MNRQSWTNKSWKRYCLTAALFSIITAIFFYPVFKGYIPFPGDLLVAEYKPWQTYSYLGYNPGSFPNKVQYFDVIRQMYPWKTLAVQQLKQLEVPLWNPYNFSGSPLLANSQSAALYPLNIAYFLLPQHLAWTLLIMLQPFLAGVFTYAFTREIKISKIGATLAAVAYAFSLFVTVFLEYNTIIQTTLWLPLLLLLIEKSLQKVSLWTVILFVISLVSSYLAGHLQVFGFVLCFVLFYGIARIFSQKWEGKKKIVHAGVFLFFVLMSLGVSAIQLFPTLELISHSARSVQSYTFIIQNVLIQPNQLILFLAPDFFGNPATRNFLLKDAYPGNAVYIGIIPLLFSFSALSKVRKHNTVAILIFASAIILLLLIRTPVSEILYKLNIPLVSTGSISNAIFLLSFCLSVLAGFGIDIWLAGKNKFNAITVVIFTIIFIGIWAVLLVFKPAANIKNFAYSTVLFSMFVAFVLAGRFFSRKIMLFAVCVIAISILDLFYFFHKFNPFVPQKLIFPEAPLFQWIKENAGINRFWGYGSAEIQSNFATQYSLFSPDGTDPLYPKRYGEFIHSSRNGNLLQTFTNTTRTDAVVNPGYGESNLAANQSRLRILDMLGVKYVLDRTENGSTEKTFPPGRFTLLYEQNGWKVFENLNVAPRAFFASEYRTFSNNDEFEKLFFAKSFNPSRTILLEKKVPDLPSRIPGVGTVQVLSYKPNKVAFMTQHSESSLLFLSDTYFPGWKAYVDGKSTEIYRADYAFRAIVVPAGKHTVTFVYKPLSFTIGAITSVSSTMVLFMMLVYFKRKSFII